MSTTAFPGAVAASTGDEGGLPVFLHGLVMDVDALRARGLTPHVEGRAVAHRRLT